MNRLLIFCSAFLLFTCGKREPSTEIIKVDPAFTGYISAFTSGVISNEGKVKIHFRESVPGAVAGEELSEGIFEVIPETKGKAYWVSDRIAEFSPDDILPSGKLFEVSFKLGEVIEVPEKLEVLTFQFQTKPQYINVSFEGLEAYNKTDLSWQRLKGQLTTSDFAYEEEVEKVLKVTQAGSAMRLNWEHAANGRTHNFVVDSISRGKTASRVILEWDGEKLLSESKAEEVIDIPPLGDFRVMDISVTQQPEQYITLFFSDPLNESQDLDGLVYLKSGTPLRLVVDDYTIKAYPSSRLTEKTQIAVAEGVRNSAGYQLKEAFLRDVKFSNQKPSVELVGDGVILPSTDGLIFPFKAVNLSAVNVKIIKVFEDNVAQFLQTNQMDGSSQMRRVGRLVYKDEVELKSMGNVDLGAWNTFALDISDLISVSSGSIYRISLSFDQSQSLYPCGESISDSEDEIDFMLEDPEIARYDGPSDYYYDDYDDYYYYYEDGYNYQERENPCARSYYMRNRRTVTRNVLASDLGIIAKSGKDKTLTVAVTDLKSTESLEGVALEVRNYQNQLIATGITDGEGMANIPIKNKPFLLVARQGSQVGYLRLDDGSSLSLSMFDVNGSEVKRGLKGYLYGERGVWRPGDSLYVSFMMEDKLNLVPDDHPIVFELYTPENQLFERKVRTSAIKGLYDFRTATKMESPTGNWLAKVKVGGASFTKTLKIETVKPNRLKINIDFNDPILKSGKPSTGDLSLKWLHGAIARNLKADVEVTLQEGNQPFEDYKEYTFNDPTKRFDAQTKFIFDGKVNDQGTAQVSAKFSVQGNAPGLLDANFKVRAFEEGGDFSVDRFKMPYSPYSSYVGLKIPKGKGWNDALYSNEPNLLPVVTLDEDGNPVRRDQLKIEVYQIGWRWWWERNEREDLASYIRSSSSNLMKTDYVSTGSDGKATYELNFGQNTWGRKLILITDPVSGHRTGKLFYTTYRGWWSSGQGGPGGAEMLTFKTDKTKYAVGDKVQVTLPKNEEGRALVSLESGSGVIDAFWVQANADNQGMFEFETTPEMAPNAYVHIAYIQPHKVTSNDLPIRMYGVQSITIENPETHLTPVIDMPDVLEPEKNFTVKVEEKDGKGMAYTVAVVDDGLLDLTRFKTPNPWNYFYSREALGVKTWDMYKYVVGAMSGEMSGLLALGGDEELGGGKDGQKANRFKPVVQYAGPFYLEPGEEAEHTFSMPNYVGSVRTMIVAGGGEAYGKAEKTTPVKKPLMVLTTLP
ncbi:MAG: MG2 domain-containing protein, partial [Bacteroidota bacterium]